MYTIMYNYLYYDLIMLRNAFHLVCADIVYDAIITEKPNTNINNRTPLILTMIIKTTAKISLRLCTVLCIASLGHSELILKCYITLRQCVLMTRDPKDGKSQPE